MGRIGAEVDLATVGRNAVAIAKPALQVMPQAPRCSWACRWWSCDGSASATVGGAAVGVRLAAVARQYHAVTPARIRSPSCRPRRAGGGRVREAADHTATAAVGPDAGLAAVVQIAVTVGEARRASRLAGTATHAVVPFHVVQLTPQAPQFDTVVRLVSQPFEAFHRSTRSPSYTLPAGRFPGCTRRSRWRNCTVAQLPQCATSLLRFARSVRQAAVACRSRRCK